MRGEGGQLAGAGGEPDGEGKGVGGQAELLQTLGGVSLCEDERSRGGGGRHLQRWMHNASAPPSAKEAGSIAPPSSLKWGVATPGDQGGAYAAAPHPALGPPDSWPRLCAPGFPHPGLIV